MLRAENEIQTVNLTSAPAEMAALAGRLLGFTAGQPRRCARTPSRGCYGKWGECRPTPHNGSTTVVSSILRHSRTGDPELARDSYDFATPLCSETSSAKEGLVDGAFHGRPAQADKPVPSRSWKPIVNGYVNYPRRSDFLDDWSAR